MIEALVAIFIFSLATAMLAGAFSSFFKNYTNSKKIQRDIENAQYAMNLMAKTLRTSSLVTTSFPLETFDFSQSKCIVYDYADKKMQYATTTDAAPTKAADCTWGTATSYMDITSDDIVSASISSIKSDPTLNIFGKVTMALNVQDQSAATPAIPIQTSVSLRQ